MAYQYGGTSPIIPPSAVPRAVTPTIPGMPPPQGGQIQPGSLTYTSSVGPDGQVTYHLFKAMSASYQTPQGIVTGIQWIPAEATSVVPIGATPATSDIIASFNRPGDERYRDWQRDEDRRRDKDIRREEKERRRQERDHDRERDREIRRARERDERDRPQRKSSGYAYERDLDRSFRDLDLREKERERDCEYERDKRRGSAYGDPAGYSTTPGGAYPGATGYSPGGPYNTTAQAYPPAGQGYQAPIAPRPVSPYQAPPLVPRPVSPYAQPGAIPRAASPYAPPPGAGAGYGTIPPRAASPYAPPPGGAGYGAVPPRSASPYAPPPRAASPYAPPPNTSPYQLTQGIPRSASPYQPPPSHSPYQGAGAIPGTYPPTQVVPRSASPNPYGTALGAYGAQPGYPAPTAPGYAVAGGGQYPPASYPPPGAGAGEVQPMPAPEGFSRPPNLAQPYTRFDALKVQDMDDFFENIPRMPLVLVPHDVYHEDWIRMMTDLSLAWSGKLPVPDYARDGRAPKRTTLTSDLIDLWNASFFLRRGVEIVLFKGRERRSGRNVGAVELHLPGFDDLAGGTDSSDSDSDSDEDDSEYDDRQRYGAYGGVYGRGADSHSQELQDAKRLRKERKRADKRRRRQEKKQKKKLKEAERKYALYVTCVPPEP